MTKLLCYEKPGPFQRTPLSSTGTLFIFFSLIFNLSC